MWVAALSLHTVVGLYWYSFLFSGYRFPMPAGALLFAGGIGAIAWWWVRARGVGRKRASPRAQVRHRRMALLIAYGLGCAAAALPAGISGNNQAWHRFVDADPQIVSAEADTVLDVKPGVKGDPDTVYLSGVAEFGGTSYQFDNKPVRFPDWDRLAVLEDAELWAVFDPNDLDAGFVVVNGRSDAETVLEYPVPPLLPFGLVIAACCWAVQRLLLRPRKFPERMLKPIDEVPTSLWVLFAIPCALWATGMALISALAGVDAPLQASPVDSDQTIPIVIWMLLLGPGSATSPRSSTPQRPTASRRGDTRTAHVTGPRTPTSFAPLVLAA
jgi:hypothetical protein